MKTFKEDIPNEFQLEVYKWTPKNPEANISNNVLIYSDNTLANVF